MNRSERSFEVHSRSVRGSEVQSALFSSAGQDGPHVFFGPVHYESGYAYPLIVWLHGQGDDERQLLRIMPQVSMRNYVAVAPRGDSLPAEGAADRSGCTWSQSSAGISGAEARVFDAIEAASEKYHITRRRVFLVGFDAGGTMAFRIAMNHPQRFAGAVSLGGRFPQGGMPFGNLSLARRVPLLLASGLVSEAYPAEEVCDDLRLLHTAGLSITLRQYPGGREISPQMLRDVDRWIMEQLNAPGSSTFSSTVQWLHEV